MQSQEDIKHSYLPSIIFIETTKACEYSCRHCRAESQSEASPDQLSLLEVKDILEQIKALSKEPPEVVLTGGDLLLRKDIKEIISYTHELGIPFSISPAASPLLTDRFMDFLIENRVRAVSLSIDGTEDGTHDWLRRIPGSFNLTVDLLLHMKNRGINIQVNTTVMRRNIYELPLIATLVHDMGVSAWELFFLIKTGRGIRLMDVTNEQYMQINNWLTDLVGNGWNVRTVEAPVRRVITQIRKLSPEILEGPVYNRLLRKTRYPTEINESRIEHDNTRSIRPSHKFNGTLFIGQNGEVFPSGLLPYSLGNVRHGKLKDIISDHVNILDSHHALVLEGKCGLCEFRSICGGSRARAYAYTGDPFAEDPACLYIPIRYKQRVSLRQH